MKKFLILSAALLLSGPALAASKIKTIDSSGHQPIKAEVQNDDPSNFTINVGKMANMNVNKKSPTYVMYTGASLPKQCGDFRKEDIDYQKPDKFHRIFDLSKKPEVIQALKDYGCVVIPNKPKLPPAKS
mgnify:FL=1